MDSTEYAPAPWAIEAGPRPGSESWYVQDAIGNDVCRVRGGEPTTAGNARLIAAAPEMRKALEAYEMVYAEYCAVALPQAALSPQFRMITEIVGQARKALALLG